MKEVIKNKLALVPAEPGCYLMKDKSGEVIYVGKAKRLRTRVRSYFTGSHDIKTTRLIAEIVDFEFIITSSEMEALILELNLIKQYDPRFNIMLKDDKSYPYLKITNERHPRLIITREVKEDGAEYFGPYPNVYAARETTVLLDKMFPLRKCRPSENKFCLYYHINQCLGACGKEVSREEYEPNIKQIRRILKGNIKELIPELTERIEVFAGNLQFEKAKEMRDLVKHLKQTVEKQKIVLSDQVDRDIFGYTSKNGFLSIQVFYMRGGKLIERETLVMEHYHEPREDFAQFIIQFYQNKNNIKPDELLIPSVDDVEIIEGYLKIPVLIPKIGDKKKLVDLAIENAEVTIDNRIKLLLHNESKTRGAVKELAEYLNMEEIRRIEAFDNSHISGSEAISGMVVYLDGSPSKRDYRKYKIRFANEADDYDYMREVIYRRYFRVLKDDLVWPDLIVIDGGKGQVNVCKEVLTDLNMDIKVVGLVKDERHQTSELLDGDTMGIIALPKRSKAFHLLMNIQEEVHRYAITFHRQLRGKKMTKSFLDEVEGIGPARKKMLLKHFGSIKKIKGASVEELQEAGIPYQVSLNVRDKGLKSK